jgi:uncharacterized sporulation protein YeaH/YhbH (DUF444 family)
MSSSGQDAVASRQSVLWYDLFSRGSRDWLRHNEKVRAAVRERLPEIAAGADFSGGGTKTIQVPVRMLEHAHFRLRPPEQPGGAGQGKAKPGDVLGQRRPTGGKGPGPGGDESGGIEFVLEFKVEDLVDWMWEELELPNLKARVGKVEQSDWIREGWDKRGAQSRLDRRRSLKEAIKRRAVQPGGASFANDDLRFRQLARREQPAIQAVVFFVMDVSASMSDEDRRLAKAFFFWVMQGLKRQYKHLETVFVAHTDEAWQFNEEQFFQASGSGGTVASTAFAKVRDLTAESYPPERWNSYVFYASDGDNVASDREPAKLALDSLAGTANYVGYTEIWRGASVREPSEMTRLFEELAASCPSAGSHPLRAQSDIWDAVRAFFASGAVPARAGATP